MVGDVKDAVTHEGVDRQTVLTEIGLTAKTAF